LYTTFDATRTGSLVQFSSFAVNRALDKMVVVACCEQGSTTKASVEQGGDEFAPVHAEDLQYTDAKTYIMLEICLHQPLIRKRDTEELAKR